MSSTIIGIGSSSMEVGNTRSRQAPKPRSHFQDVLRKGADVLLTGAGMASRLVGGPLLSAAIGMARAGLVTSGDPGIAQTTSGSVGNSPLASALGQGTTQNQGTSAGSEVEAMRQLQQQGYQQSLQYLTLQQEVQHANRRFTLASNLLKAKHDTARSAINNVRT